jgi:hypothetical protein
LSRLREFYFLSEEVCLSIYTGGEEVRWELKNLKFFKDLPSRGWEIHVGIFSLCFRCTSMSCFVFLLLVLKAVEVGIYRILMVLSNDVRGLFNPHPPLIPFFY